MFKSIPSKATPTFKSPGTPGDPQTYDFWLKGQNGRGKKRAFPAELGSGLFLVRLEIISPSEAIRSPCRVLGWALFWRKCCLL